MSPSAGVHKAVATVDYLSMYPTIMLCASIAPENVSTTYSVGAEGSVCWDTDSVVVHTSREMLRFRIDPDVNTRQVLRFFMETTVSVTLFQQL